MTVNIVTHHQPKKKYAVHIENKLHARIAIQIYKLPINYIELKNVLHELKIRFDPLTNRRALPFHDTVTNFIIRALCCHYINK